MSIVHQQANPRRQAHLLATVEAFGGLSAEEIDELEAKLEIVSVTRGAFLIRQGEQSDALYLVVSGRFRAYREGQDEAIAEIGSGYPIGEIAFFSGVARTASVRAERDSLVLKLGRGEFEALARRSPAIWHAITGTLARRLTAATKPTRRDERPRTIAICCAGSGRVPDQFIRTLRTAFEAASRCAFFNSSEFHAAFPFAVLDSSEATSLFNELEAGYECLFYVADAELTPWSQKAMRQADLVLIVGVHQVAAQQPAPEPNELERFAFGLHGAANLRLVLLHESRGAIAGTRRWLDARPTVHMHHHVALDHLPDYERLRRFIAGTALGLVACGGGAFCAAHLGLYQALGEAGLTFDMMGGTSGGGAMTAAFAAGADAEQIDRGVHEIFVRSRALRRWTWPRYSLLDHAVLDRMLEQHYSSNDIEDLWMPYFAVSTNLSTNAIHLHRRGPLWEAVRATASIPALLPPFFTDAGEMLVDGSLLDNVPVQAMRSLKSGPNVVINFELPGLERFDVDYRALPSRRDLMWGALNPFSRKRLPRAPGPVAVLVRSLMVGRQDFAAAMQDGDLLLVPPLPSGVGPMDWQHHARLKAEAYAFASVELDRLRASGHPLLSG